jgi:hypothetical protein
MNLPHSSNVRSARDEMAPCRLLLFGSSNAPALVSVDIATGESEREPSERIPL